jgi:hypothetical protein
MLVHAKPSLIDTLLMHKQKNVKNFFMEAAWVTKTTSKQSRNAINNAHQLNHQKV